MPLDFMHQHNFVRLKLLLHVPQLLELFLKLTTALLHHLLEVLSVSAVDTIQRHCFKEIEVDRGSKIAALGSDVICLPM